MQNSKSGSTFGDNVEPIAVVGLSCRFPGEASSAEKLWDLLVEGRTGHSETPIERYNADGWYHPNPDRRGAINHKSGFFIKEDVTRFDAPFFSITAKEAASMDPMHRMLLEVAYETFENAGVSMDELVGSATSVYTGCMTDDYDRLSTRDIYDSGHNAASGTSRAMLSNRLSWFFDLRGPSLTLDTACSSSLYALHLACQSLRLGESKMGFVAGVNLMLHPNITQRLTAMHMLSPDGISHSFDSRANGYGRGEAIAGLVVKRLSDALADGDTIRAVIRCTGTNQDGHTPGITMPSAESQANLITSVYKEAGLHFNDTAYFEAHGTGTSIGDPTELSAVAQTFGAVRDPEQPLLIGSVKANVGHTEGCAGLAGLFKAILCLEKGVIAPTPGIEQFNPRLKLSEWKVSIPTKLTAWPNPHLRRASVQSFGFGGSNAHAIVDDAANYLRSHGLKGNHNTVVEERSESDSGISSGAEEAHVQPQSTSRLFVFSSRDQGALERLGLAHGEHLAQRAKEDDLEHDPTYFDHLAYTLAERRSHLDYRSYAVADSLASLRKQLSKKLPKGSRVSKKHEAAWVFTGQGAQWAGMGREMMVNSVFRASVQESQKHLDSFGCVWDIVEELNKTKDSRVDSAEFSQPLCSVLQIALVDVLRWWGLRPTAVVGHSSGEIGAAYAAGRLSHRDAIKAAFYRGVFSIDVNNRISGKTGAMMAAGISEEEAVPYLSKVPEGSAVIACVNSPSSVTISGDETSVNQLAETISADGKFARRLKVTTAYHSPHMKTIADDYLKSLGSLESLPGTPGVAFFSSVTGRIAENEPLNENYWVQNLCGQVRFSQAVTSLLKHTEDTGGRRRKPINWTAIVEIGPHAALKGPLKQIMAEVDKRLEAKITYSSLLSRGENSEHACIGAVGNLWALGHPVNLTRINNYVDQKTLGDLPSYQWNHQNSFFFQPVDSAAERVQDTPRTDLLGVREPRFNPLEPRWRNFIRIPENPWIADHVITGTVLYPAAGMLVMVMEAGAQLCLSRDDLEGFTFEDVHFERGLVIASHDDAVETNLSLKPHRENPSIYDFALSSLGADRSWTKHCYGTFSVTLKRPASEVQIVREDAVQWNLQKEHLSWVKQNASKAIDTETFYGHLQDIGMEYGPLFALLKEAGAVPGQNSGWGVVEIPDLKGSMPYQFEYPHFIHPATLDAIFHLLFIAFTEGDALPEAAVPVTLEKMYISADLPTSTGSKFVGYSTAASLGKRENAGNLVVTTEDMQDAKIVISNFAVREVSSESAAQGSGDDLLSRKHCGVVYWKEDLDFLLDHAQLASALGQDSSVSAQLATLLDTACHKNAGLRVLCLEIDHDTLHPLLEPFAPKPGHSRRLGRCVVAGLNQAPTGRPLPEDLVIEYQNSAFELLVSEAKAGDFDLIIKQESSTTLDDLVKTLFHSKTLLVKGGLSVTVGSFSTDEKEITASISQTGLEPLLVSKDVSNHQTFVLARQPTEENLPALDKILLLVPDQTSQAFSTFQNELTRSLTSICAQVEIITLADIDQFQNANIISLLEAERPLTTRWTPQQLDGFKALVATARYVLWITRGAQPTGPESVEFGATTGLLRTIRNEALSLSIPQLSLSSSGDLTAPTTVDVVLSAFKSSLKPNSDMEYTELNGRLLVPRVIEAESFDRELELHNGVSKPVLGELDLSVEMKLTHSKGSGYIWVQDDESASPLPNDQVEVRVQAACFVGEDHPSIQSYRPVVGTISRIGSDVDDFSIGQKVVALGKDGFKTFVRQHHSLVQGIPQAVASDVAAAVSFDYLTAFYGLVEVGRLGKGDSVLVHDAGSKQGQAAIEISQHFKTRVLATVRSKEEKQHLITVYGLAESDIFDAEDLTFADAVSRVTDSRGVDVAFGYFSGSAVRAAGSCIAELGHIVNTNLSIGTVEMPVQFTRRSASLAAADIQKIASKGRTRVSRLAEAVFDLLRRGAIDVKYHIDSHSVANLDQALKTGPAYPMDAVIITLENGALVPMLPPAPPELQLDSAATYVLVGGLGALGISISDMMIEHGARHLVFLSRSGEGDAKEKLDEFRARGCRIDALKCSVLDAADVKKFAEESLEKGWRIKGVVQAAMVLGDAIFENMDHDKWTKVTQPKVQGSWNLHQYLPRDMDFFILLSSIVAIIGNTAQANYAAGNAYMDALANFRHAHGLAATSLNVGLVSDAIQKRWDLDDYLKMYGHMAGLQINVDGLNTVLLSTMRGRTADDAPIPPQLIAGINADLRRSGASLNTWTKDRKFDHRVVDTGDADAAGQGVKDALREATTIDEAARVVEFALKENLALAMTADPEDMDVEKPIHALGVDSLKAVEFRNWIFKEMECEVSVFELLSATPLSKLAFNLARKSALVNPEVAKQGAE
jgi:acyl transferase domain-containing protein/NADPH:quinone reductase-like Zn-dependent oxidoreductase/NAD(P)-dependent dehydrogenase (short-subunit alcohol dehydrogenase family)